VACAKSVPSRRPFPAKHGDRWWIRPSTPREKAKTNQLRHTAARRSLVSPQTACGTANCGDVAVYGGGWRVCLVLPRVGGENGPALGTVSPSESRASRPIHRSTARRGRPTPGGVLVHMSVTTASNTTVTDSDVGMFHPPCPRPPGPLRTGTAKAQRWSRLLPASAGPSLVRHVLFVPSPQLEPPRRKGTSVTNPANRQSVR
jgi:hypothetical protein